MNPKIGRREWLQTLVATGLWFAADGRDLVDASDTLYEAHGLYTLETGHQGDRGGPIAQVKGTGMLWFTTEPEAPYLSRYAWPMTRINVRLSKDACRSWGVPLSVAHGTQQYSVLSHAALQLRSGVIIHIHVHYSGYVDATASSAKSLNPAFIQKSYDGGRTWSDAVLLPTGERYISDVLSVTQISTGRVIYPFGFLSKTKGHFKTSVLYSDDDGKTWTRSRSVLGVGGTGFETGASEPSVVELPGGRLWMLIRAQTGFLWESFSLDNGRTWEEATPSGIPSSNSPGTALMLSSGKVALVWNNSVDSAYTRRSLMIALTEDGRHFIGAREIDRTDSPDDCEVQPAHVTYPYLAESADGGILVSYNRGHWLRHNFAKLANVDASWVNARRELVDFRNGRVDWCSVDPGPLRRAAVETYASPEDSQPGASIEIRQPHNSQERARGMTRNLPLIVEGEMQVALSVIQPEGYLLWHDTFLEPGQVGEVFLRARFSRDGKVFFAAGAPTRRHSAQKGRTYSFLAYPIISEQRYPRSIELGKRFEVRLRYSATARRAEFQIDDGPTVQVVTGHVLGLAYFGIAIAQNGVLRLRRLTSTRS